MFEAGKCVACAEWIPVDLYTCRYTLRIDALEHVKMEKTNIRVLVDCTVKQLLEQQTALNTHTHTHTHTHMTNEVLFNGVQCLVGKHIRSVST